MARNRRSPRSRRGRARPGRPEILIFSENRHNDGEPIRIIAESYLRGRGGFSFRVSGRPISLTREAKPPAVRKWLTELQGEVAGRDGGGRNVIAVLVHRDADRPDPSGEEKRRLDADLRRSLEVRGYAVVPVQAIEAWWLAYPEALHAARACWRDLTFHGNPEARGEPKRHLRELTRKCADKTPYTESNSQAIARHLVDLAGWSEPWRTPQSLRRFLVDLDTICGAATGR